jgi:hypothetical protein
LQKQNKTALPTIAYAITCHDSTDFIAFQFNLLNAETAVFFYHVDAKAPPELQHYVMRLALEHDNVFVLPPRLISWAGHSQTQAMMSLLEAAVARPGWTQLIYLSEQHLPLQPHEVIRNTLLPGHDYLEANPCRDFTGTGREDVANRFTHIYRELPGVGSFVTGVTDPGDVFWNRLHHGSNWIALCFETASRLAKSTNLDTSFFAHSVHTDETFLPTEIAALAPTNLVQTVLTFVAFAWNGGNDDMTFEDPLFQTARDQGFLFIRKRKRTLSPALATQLQTIAPIAQPARFACDNATILNAANASTAILEALNARLQAFGIALQKVPNAPAKPSIYFIAHYPSLRRPCAVYVASETLEDFKIIAVLHDQPTNFADLTFGPFTTSLLRVRLHDIFYQREIHVGADLNDGFYQLGATSDLGGLATLIAHYVRRTATLSCRP